MNLSRLSKLAIVSLALLFFGELLRHPSWVLYSDHSDLLALHLPTKRFLARASQRHGEIPRWNPHSFSGSPLVSDVPVGCFYPLHLPYYLLREELAHVVASWLVVLHVAVAGLGMHAYARWRGLHKGPAFIAAVGFMLGGKWMLHLLAAGHTIWAPVAWLPWILLHLERGIATTRLRDAIVAGFLFSMVILGGHPQLTLLMALFLALATASHTSLARWLAHGVAAGTTATLLGAVQIVPAIVAVPETTRYGGIGIGEVLRSSVPTLLGLFGPPLSSPRWEAQGGIAILWAGAALGALTCGRSARSPAILLAFSVAFALGAGALLQPLPGFSLFATPARIMMLAALPLALLAGTSTHALFEPSAPPVSRRRARVLVLVAVALGLGLSGLQALALTRAGQPPRAHVYWLSLLLSIPAALASLSGAPTPARRNIFMAALLFDAWALSHPLVEVRHLDAVYPVSSCVRFLAERRAESREPFRVLEIPYASASDGPLGTILPQLGGIEIEPVLGYNSFDLAVYRRFLRLAAGEHGPPLPRRDPFGYSVIPPFPVKRPELLDLMGVRYVLAPSSSPPSFLLDRRYRPVMHDPSPSCYSFLSGGVRKLPPYTVWENSRAFPRAFVVPKGGEGRRTVSMASRTPNRIELDLGGGPGGDLVVTEVWFPGWRIEIDGRPAELRRTHLAFLGVSIPDGAQRAVLSFHVKGWP